MRGNLGGTGASKERIRLLQAGRAWVWLALIVYVGLWGLWSRAALAQDALCAEVKIVIEQKLSLERQAFDARMVIRNGLDASALSNVKVELLFKDQEQRDVVATTDPNATGATFFVRLDGLSGLSALDGSSSLSPKANADIRWLLIPAQGAGGTTAEGKLYYVGARVTYTLNGETTTVEVTPDYVVVRPQPLLQLDYFLPTDVHGDDPFTPETEAAEPFTLGVRVANVGAGPAAKTQIESAQPKIVENRQGLLIDFTILGGYVGNAAAGKSLLLDFGDIAPQSAKMGRWLMQTSLAGRFTEFNASFVHADSLGGAVTSLIQEVVAHKLVRDVRIDLPGHDDVDDFLAEYGDGYRVYDSHGSENPVFNLSGTASLNTLPGGNLTLQFPATQGMVHVKLADPARGARKPVQVLRSDGKQLLPQNFWLSKSRNADLSWSYFVHVFDFDTPGQYTLVFTESTEVSLSGTAYLDANGNGVRDAGEAADGNLMVTLKGIDNQGRNVSVQAYTDPQGSFAYSGLAQGRYQIEAAERSGWVNGTWVAGSAGGTVSSGLISDIVLLSGSKATGYILSKRKPSEGNNQTAVADVAVSIQSSAHELYPGQLATVTITARNQGPGEASGVAVQTTLPDGLSQQAASAGQGSYAPGVWSVGTLRQGESAALTLQVKAEPLGDSHSRSITWTATAGSQASDPVADNNQNRLNLLVQKDPRSGADLLQTLVAQARVLVWAECPEVPLSANREACAMAKADMARTWLSDRLVHSLTTTRLEDWRVALRGGTYNVLWFVGGMSGLDELAHGEIRAAVRRGDSLIVEGAAGASLVGLSDVLGAVSSDVSAGENLAVTLQGGSPSVTKGTAYALQLATAVPAATYAVSGAPAIARRAYGHGQAMLVGFGLLDTAADANHADWSAYGEQQLQAMTPAVRTQPALAGSSFGLQLKARSLALQGSPGKAVSLKLDLTSGLAYRDAVPSAQTGSTSTRPTWEWVLSAGQEESVALTLVTPQLSATGESKAQLLDASDQSPLAVQTLDVQVLGLDTLVPRIQHVLAGLAGATTDQQVLVGRAREAATQVEQAQTNGQWGPALESLVALQTHLEELAGAPDAPALTELQLDVARWFFLIQVHWAPEAAQPPAQITAISGGGQTAVVGQAFSRVLVAQVLDGNGQPVAGAAVRFELPVSGAGASFVGGVASVVVVTDEHGTAHSTTLAANTAEGAYLATASVPGVAAHAVFALENRTQPAQESLLQIVDGQGQSAIISTPFAKALSVRLVDVQGRPQSGITVRFEAPATGASAMFDGLGANVAAAQAVTDASGLAVSPLLRANTNAGSFQIRASAPGVTSDAIFTLQNQAPATLNLLLVDGQGQSARLGSAFGKPLSVRVVDEQGRPQNGMSVRFEAPTNGASAQFDGQGSGVASVQVTTDASGLAVSPVLRANSAVGTYQVRAALASSASAAQVFSLTNTAVPVPTPVFSGTTATGSGKVTASVSGGGPNCAFNPDATRLLPASGMGAVLGQILLPHGVFDFELISCTPGSEVTITTTWPDLRGITGYLKYGVTPISGGVKLWYPPTGLRINGNTVVYTIRDGGWGDDDLTVNGVIRDPGGPVIASAPASPEPIPAIEGRTLAVLSALLCVLAGAAFRRSRRRA